MSLYRAVARIWGLGSTGLCIINISGYVCAESAPAGRGHDFGDIDRERERERSEIKGVGCRA